MAKAVHKGELVRKRITQSGVSVKSIAARLGVSRQTLYDYLERDSWRQHKASLAKLIRFRPVLPFYQLTPPFMEELEAWLKGSLRQKPNTIWNFFKTMRTYINLARAEGKIMDYPFDKFKIRRQDTDPVYVNEEELQRMFMLLQSEKLPNMQRRTLKRFLFSALTSLRYGDVHSITWKENIRDQQIEFIPAKTKRKGKIVRVPLLPEAAMMAENLTGNVFGKMSLQKINASLKIVAARCGISKKLSFHASRHTFGYLFIRRGGDVLTLKEIMGHSDINTTMIYVHLNDSQKREGIRRMEGILKSST